MKIGLLGGTFNPIHFGHLINAEVIRSAFSLDKIIFIPSKSPVHKELAGNVSAEDRFNMVKLSIQGNEGFRISSIEIDRDSPSYTIITLKELKKTYPHSSLFLIIGDHYFNEIDKWKDSEEIMQLVQIIVMRRSVEKIIPDELIIAKSNAIIAENPVIEISSTSIRERIKSGKSIRYQVPPVVIDYIREKGLYKN
ncbi:nicotinate-nucleotide adenylyltransferase [Spirochaetota bacterium]